MGMEKACQSLLGQPRVSATERRIYRGMLAGLKSGKSIGDALGGSSPAISALEHEVISASEAGGRLEKGFGHLAAYFRRLDTTRRKVVKGLVYPLVLIHLAIPVSTLMTVVSRSFSEGGEIVPVKFREAFLDSGKGMLVAYGVVLVGILLFAFLLRQARSSPGIDRLLRAIPILGEARRSVAMERFSQVFEIFLMAGAKMSEALASAGRASGSGLIWKASQAGARRVASGDLLASAINAFPGVFPADFSKGIAVAEESGQLDREMAEWGRYYYEAAAEAMERLGEWTPRLFYWAILLFVAVLIVRAGLAYRDLLMNLIEGDF